MYKRVTSVVGVLAVLSCAVVAQGAVRGDEVSGELAALRDDVRRVLARSRGELLGSRDPLSPSCVQLVKSGQIGRELPGNPGDYDGGPGTKLAILLHLDRGVVTRPTEDFAYHQGRLRRYLENQLSTNAEAFAGASTLATRARELAERMSAAPSLKAWGPVELNEADRATWPGYCLTGLNDALAAGDDVGARRWAWELASACMTLEDLHRWLGFLANNYLEALAFQARCRSLFEAADGLVAKYDKSSTMSWYPAGMLTLHGDSNFYEVEHRAERTFSVPPDRVEALVSSARRGTWEQPAVWVHPANREAFMAVRDVLSPANRTAWEEAVRSPFDHLYVTNMLDRARRSGGLEGLVEAVRRFNDRRPAAGRAELLGVLMYRGHSFAGLEWSDRFLPQLVTTAAGMRGMSPPEALTAAQRWAYGFFTAPAASYGVTFTLRDAMEDRRLDCVRATDLIAALYRNAGFSRFGHVRWTTETNGHSVAAAFVDGPDGRPRAILADGLKPADAPPATWPDAYFDGEPWPASLPGNRQPYAVELYVRGLDNYVWSQGYIVRGENAGWLVRSAVPYLPGLESDRVEKVHPGPYPR